MILQSLVLIILARLLTPKDFGLIGVAFIIVNLSSIFSSLGIGPAITQRKLLNDIHLRTGFTISTIFGIFMTGIVVMIAPYVGIFFRMPQLTPILRVISLVFILQGVSTVAQSLLTREIKFNVLSKIQILSYFFGYCIVGISLAINNFKVWSLVYAHLVQQSLNCFFLLTIQPHPKKPQINRNALHDLLFFGGYLTVAKINNYIALQGDNFIVGQWLGAEALGLYGRAYQLMVSPVTLFGQVLDKVLCRMSVRNHPQKSYKRQGRGQLSPPIFPLYCGDRLLWNSNLHEITWRINVRRYSGFFINKLLISVCNQSPIINPADSVFCFYRRIVVSAGSKGMDDARDFRMQVYPGTPRKYCPYLSAMDTI